MTYGTLPSRFLNAIDSRPNSRALMARRNGVWESIASAELLRRVAGLSMALVELGVKPGDRVALFAANRPEWHTADFAINGSGGVTVPVYCNESPDRMTFIVKHCGAEVIVVAGDEQLKGLAACRAQLPELEHVIVADIGDDVPTECLRYETLITSAGGAEIAAYRMRAAQVLPGQLCSIIYTSGTTGEPKGVMLTHNNMSSNVTDSCATFDFEPASDIALSFLPLAHVYGRMLDYIYLFNGVSVAYVESVDLVPQALLEIHPTVIAAVPRFFEKIYAKLMEQGSKATGIKRKLFDWAVDVARRAAPWRTGAKGVSPFLKAQWALANRLVYKKIRAGTAGGKFVAPQPIENALKTSPYILNAMIVGDQRRFVVALIVPNATTVSAKAQEQGLRFASHGEMASHPAVRALIEGEVKRLTAHLAQWETVKRFALLPEDFTFDNGSLTFTLKLKRRVVEQNYREIIDKLYAESVDPVASKSRS